MARKFYSEQERFSILSVVNASRENGHKWADVHKFAKKSGFRGGVPALMIFVSKAKKKTLKPRSVIAVATQADPHVEIQKTIDRIVQERVRVALEQAIKVLKSSI